MPLFATLMAQLFAALVSLFQKFMGVRVAMQLASYVTWLSLLSAFVGVVYVCVGGILAGLQSMVGATNGVDWVALFWMGLGMFVPANASAVISCIGSVWLACGVYRIQAIGLTKFS